MNIAMSCEKALLLDLNTPVTDELLQQVADLLKSGQRVVIMRVDKEKLKEEWERQRQNL